MIEQPTLPEQLEAMEIARAQDFRLMDARFASVESSIEALSKKLDARFLELDRKIEGLNEKMRLLLTHTTKLLKHLEE